MISILAVVSSLTAGFPRCCGGQEEFKKCDLGSCLDVACVDCVWNEWSEWGASNCEGLCDRHRTIGEASNCGKPCEGAKVETKRCKPTCYVERQNCEFGEWKEWSACDSACDGGQQYRVREITQMAEDHGVTCEGVTKETRTCASQSCFNAMDCKLGDWTSWGSCSMTCDSGQVERHRVVFQHSGHGGIPCDGNLCEVRECTNEPCQGKLDCAWNEWGNWSACSETCGGGEYSRSRLISVAPRNGGALCEPLDMSETAHCNTMPCAAVVDCVFGPWTKWDACSCSCNGVQHRVRHISIFPEDGGKPCSGNLREVQKCNTGDACDVLPGTEPVDCALDEWSAWDSCSSSCGTGQRVRHRGFLHHHHNGGKSCSGVLQLIEACPDLPECLIANAPTPLDCVWGEWDGWGACTVSCGGGVKMRHRGIRQTPNVLGKPCEHQAAMEVAACRTDTCECSDCEFDPWSDWGGCTCTGLRDRHRNIKSHNHLCGHACKGAKVVTESCHPNCMSHSVHCDFNPWSGWSVCTASCEGGEARRDRSIKHLSQNGGAGCAGDLKEIRPCNTQRCGAPHACHVTEWSEWTACTASCNGGQSFRERRIKGEEERGGHTCKAALKEVLSCGNEQCGTRKDCAWGEWSEYSACSAHCGGGIKTRDRFVTVSPRVGGKLCDPVPKSEVAACNTQPCVTTCVDARWSEWSSWSVCSVSCGKGWRHRDRSTAQSANHCGKGLIGKKQEFTRCGLPCERNAQDCELSEWSDYGDCSCSCNGVHDRNRRISAFASQGGKNCDGPLKELQSCNVGLCHEVEPIDCQLGDWEPWEACTARCGGGQKFRSRRILISPKHEGQPCDPPIREVFGCNNHACELDVDCTWDEWSQWGSCSRECGGGEKMRYRQIKMLPRNQGRECDPHSTMEVAPCNEVGCAGTYYCGFGAWSTWSECSVTCGIGEIMRRRELELSQEKTSADLLISGNLNQVFVVTFEDLTGIQMVGVFLGGIVFSMTLFAVASRIHHRVAQRLSSDEQEECLLED
eukprot:GEMP01002728.1.p1 GENE.GEMP01002728.1~~GEMP01002728.1.p1  ORF type:complete len:1021 (+),score=174.28 GEMP01002728.1:156-3218(+)